MNIGAAMRMALWPLALAGAAALGRSALAPVAAAREGGGRRGERDARAASSPYAADSLAARAEAGDLFRLGRAPSAVRYDPASGAAPEGWTPPRPPRPALRLTGLVGGAEPAAAIEGLPEVEGGRLLRVGERLAGFRIVSIDGGRVRVAGQDTVWVLTLRQQ